MDSPLDYTNYLKLFSCCPHKEELRDRQVYSYVEEGVLSSQFILTTSASVMELLISTNLFRDFILYFIFYFFIYPGQNFNENSKSLPPSNNAQAICTIRLSK